MALVIQYGVGVWILALFFWMLVLRRRPDVDLVIWAGEARWTVRPSMMAARAIQWRRQRTGERVLERIVGYHRGSTGL